MAVCSPFSGTLWCLLGDMSLRSVPTPSTPALPAGGADSRRSETLEGAYHRGIWLRAHSTLFVPVLLTGSGHVSGASHQHCEQTEAEGKSEGGRTGGKLRLALVQLPGCVPSAQCQPPSLASVSLWVPAGLITAPPPRRGGGCVD